MLPQLVGMSCGVCAQRIGAVIDGRYCEGCGNPIHNACAPPPRPVSNDDLLSAPESRKCPRCGCDPKNPTASHIRDLWLSYRAFKEVEDELPLLETSARMRMGRGAIRDLAAVLLCVLTAAIVFVAVKGGGDATEKALICIGVPWVAAGFLLLVIHLAAKKERKAMELWDQVTDEKERARIERGEPPG